MPKRSIPPACDGVIHRAFFTQRGDHFGHVGRALANGTIHAQHILVALIEYRIDRDRGLAGLPVADDQFALAAPMEMSASMRP